MELQPIYWYVQKVQYNTTLNVYKISPNNERRVNVDSSQYVMINRYVAQHIGNQISTMILTLRPDNNA